MCSASLHALRRPALHASKSVAKACGAMEQMQVWQVHGKWEVSPTCAYSTAQNETVCSTMPHTLTKQLMS